MNTAHFHLLVNHFPIVSLFIAMPLFLMGCWRKNQTLQQVAYAIFVFSGIATALSMYSGEGAEEAVENLQQVTHELIHEHEEWAEKLALLQYLTAALSLVAFWASHQKQAWQSKINIAIGVLALAGLVLCQPVGNSGGQIRHTEIRCPQVGDGGPERSVPTHLED
jgi:uncharacterized membrane protein